MKGQNRKCCTSAGVWPGFASVSLTAQVIMEVFVLYSTGGVQFVQQPHPCQLIQAPSSLSLIRPQYLLNDTKPCTWPLYCAAAVQLYSAVNGLPTQLATSTLYKSRGCCCNFIHIHYLYLRHWVITISDKISPKHTISNSWLYLSPCDNVSDSCTMSGAVLLPCTIYWSSAAQAPGWRSQSLLSVHQAAGPSS